MPEKKYDYDVVVIGGGPAGIFAAIEASKKGFKAVILEKNSTLAKKLLLTGGGRSNITNAEQDLKKLVSHYNNGEFLYHAFSVFGTKQTVEFFEKLGIKTKIEKHNKVFPVSNNAKDILDGLQEYLKQQDVTILFNSEVIDIKKVGKSITKIILKDREISARYFILTTGGKSYPLMGSDGLGYMLAEKLGHTIVDPLPALAPIKIKEEWVRDLRGISLEDVRITLILNDKKIISEEGEMVFTHFGVSGPAILNISATVAQLLLNNKPKISLDLFPWINTEELHKGLEEEIKKNISKTIKNIISIFMAERMAEKILETNKINKDKVANNMTRSEREGIAKLLKNIVITPEEVLGFDLAKTTKGGISLKEIDHKTMKSKIIKNLAFAGEIIDVDGKSGGFNLQMCWSTGFLAGKSI